MENEYQLVVADIDGTLIEKGAPLGERSKDAIRRLREHGVYFGIASGRDVDIQVLHQYKVWGFDRNFEIVIGMEKLGALYHLGYDDAQAHIQEIKQYLGQ